MTALNELLWGALAMSAAVAGLLFLRLWRASRDRLFVFLALAFWLLSINWLGLGVSYGVEETRHVVYVVRLLAFCLIIAGVLDKNARGRGR